MMKSSSRPVEIDMNLEPAQLEIEEGAALNVQIYASANLPTRHGKFRIVAFTNNRDGKEHIAILRGDVEGAEHLPTRIHSECLTGDVFGSLKCDCRQQLELALDRLAVLDAGLILYMRQEGRGIGLANKIKTYALQELGLDTVEANLHLGFDDDLRDYEIAARMIHLLGIRSVNLMTNNPKKVQGLTESGVEVSKRMPILIQPNAFNKRYLRVKKEKSGHLLMQL